MEILGTFFFFEMVIDFPIELKLKIKMEMRNEKYIKEE